MLFFLTSGIATLWYNSVNMQAHTPKPFYLYIANQLNTTAGMNVVHNALYSRNYGKFAQQAGINFTCVLRLRFDGYVFSSEPNWSLIVPLSLACSLTLPPLLHRTVVSAPISIPPILYCSTYYTDYEAMTADDKGTERFAANGRAGSIVYNYRSNFGWLDVPGVRAADRVSPQEQLLFYCHAFGKKVLAKISRLFCASHCKL